MEGGEWVGGSGVEGRREWKGRVLVREGADWVCGWQELEPGMMAATSAFGREQGRHVWSQKIFESALLSYLFVQLINILRRAES